MSKKLNYNDLKSFCEAQGIDLFGTADISGIKEAFEISKKLLDKFDKAVCIGLRLATGVLEEIEDFPTRLYFHHYRTANFILDQIAFKAGHYIQKNGYLALPVAASQILDWQKQTAHLSHKKIGYLAGLGWIGRNNLLVNEKLGSHFRLGTILTNMPLEIDKPVNRDCGDCKLCVEVCPCGAIKDNPADFEHIKCFEKLKEFQKQRLVDQYVCGVCVNACQGE
ncbi:MAG: hypothetical protein ABIH18_05365 [Candidatus Omnitrophota bacterium]